MGPNLIALAVPLFFVGIAIELWAAHRRGLSVYRLADAVSDMGCGIAQQTSQIFYAVGLTALYSAAHAKFSVVRFADGSPWPWVIAFVGVEFAYYWWHRLSHEVNFLWAGHVVHHQSEDYNLAVALRQSVLTSFTVFPFYVLLAFLGVPALHFGVAVGISTLYQFWIHTQLVGKLGFLEKWLNTPALHRVHHAINPRYIDKNYGGIVIVFDRLFGTYEPETEAPVYGLVAPLKSFNPIWAEFQYLFGLVKRSRTARTFGDAVRVWTKGPEWFIPGVEQEHLPQPVSPQTYRKFDVVTPALVRGYVFAHFVAVVGVTFTVMMWGSALSTGARVAVASVVFVSLACFGGLLEGRRWAFRFEPLRLAFLAGVAAAVAPTVSPVAIALVATLAVGSAALRVARRDLRGPAPVAVQR